MVSLAQFNELFEKAFVEHDVNNDGVFDSDEAKTFAAAFGPQINPDFNLNEDNFSTHFANLAGSADGTVTKEKAHAGVLQWAKNKGFVTE